MPHLFFVAFVCSLYNIPLFTNEFQVFILMVNIACDDLLTSLCGQYTPYSPQSLTKPNKVILIHYIRFCSVFLSVVLYVFVYDASTTARLMRLRWWRVPCLTHDAHTSWLEASFITGGFSEHTIKQVINTPHLHRLINQPINQHSRYGRHTTF